jgi:hypothetical protein
MFWVYPEIAILSADHGEAERSYSGVTQLLLIGTYQPPENSTYSENINNMG